MVQNRRRMLSYGDAAEATEGIFSAAQGNGRELRSR
jgi:hypothetical protein